MSTIFKNTVLKNTLTRPARISDLPMSNFSMFLSLRRINPNFTGDKILVRRTIPDSAEQDIGFDSNGNLDETALLAHCGAGNGFAVTLYEELKGYEFSQATASQQPQIVSSGVVIKQNGRPTLAFSRANTTVLERANTPLSILIDNKIGCAFFVLYQTFQDAMFVFMHEDSVGQPLRYAISFPWDFSVIYWDAGSYSTSRLAATGFPTITDKLVQGSCFRNDTDMSVYGNSSVFGTKNNASGTPAWGLKTLYIGSDNTSSMDGYFSEIIFSNKDLLSVRTIIENDQKNYYNT